LLFEIPSGSLADKFGRKSIIVFGKFSFLLAILFAVFIPSFLGFIFCVIAMGIHEASISGAQEALLYDNLKDVKLENSYGKLLAVATTCREIGLGSGALIAGFITQISLRYNLTGSIIIAILGFVASFFLFESKTRQLSQETKLLIYAKESIKKIKNNINLKKLLFFNLTVMVAYPVISEYFVVSLKTLNAPYSLIGIIAVAESLFFSVGSFISQKFNFTKTKNAYLWLSILMSFFFILISTGKILIVIIGFLILRTIKATAEIVSSNDWQKEVESKERATTISVNSFAKNGNYIIFSILFGYLADKVGLFKSFLMPALLSLFFLIFPLFARKLEKDKL